jgi:hypothetical protein
MANAILGKLRNDRGKDIISNKSKRITFRVTEKEYQKT